MHPLEHLLFFGSSLLPLLLARLGVGCHALHLLFVLSYARISPIGGHDGFDKPAGGSLVHYLHHTKFEVNYGTPVVPVSGTERCFLNALLQLRLTHIFAGFSSMSGSGRWMTVRSGGRGRECRLSKVETRLE